jgi:hypothetical protein
MHGLVFKSGWAAFVNAYDLVQRDILLFESSGSSCFEVRIFNQSCCEKELSCVAYDNHDMQSLQKERLATKLQLKLCGLLSIFDILAYTIIN